MPDHEDLTRDNIKSIVEYIKSESKITDEAKAPFAKPSVKKTAYVPLTLQKDYGFFLVYLAMVGVLIITLLFATKVKSIERNMSRNNGIKWV